MNKYHKILIIGILIVAIVSASVFLYYFYLPMITTSSQTTSKETTTTNQKTTTTQTKPNLAIFNSSLDMIKFATFIHYRYDNSFDQNFDIIYKVLRSEIINNREAYVINILINSTILKKITTFWIDKNDYEVIQAEEDNVRYDGEKAKMLWLSIEGLIFAPFKEFQGIWLQISSLTYKGSETKSFGYTNLTVHKYEYTPPILNHVKSAEIWTTQIKNKDILVYFYIEYDGAWIKYELLEIILTK